MFQGPSVRHCVWGRGHRGMRVVRGRPLWRRMGSGHLVAVVDRGPGPLPALLQWGRGLSSGARPSAGERGPGSVHGCRGTGPRGSPPPADGVSRLGPPTGALLTLAGSIVNL